MPRRAFLLGIETARTQGIAHIENLSLCDGDSVTFDFVHTESYGNVRVALKLIPTSLDGYPLDSSYICFTEDSDVDPKVLLALERLQNMMDKMELPEALRLVASHLHSAITQGLPTNPIVINSSCSSNIDSDQSVYQTANSTGVAMVESEDAMEWDDSDIDSDDAFGFAEIGSRPDQKQQCTLPLDTNSKGSGVSLHRIKTDLLIAKKAGFRVGVYGNLLFSGIVSISIRVTELGISEEAMQAWSVSSNQYLVLLLRFKHGYRTLEQYSRDRAPNDRVEMRVGLCNMYKPTTKEASEAFQASANDATGSQTSDRELDEKPGKLQTLFIDRSLNGLLRDRFARIVQFRGLGLSWTGAERLFNETQGSLQDLNIAIAAHRSDEDTTQQKVLPSIVKGDSLCTTEFSQASLPLVTMQFVLRHFVRCTEFCLACHCPTENTFEALKPYVCTKPLCLYQFLSYGFGASVEYEIMSQPYVVDLLVSLCFTGAAANKIRDMPLGINLKVPILPEPATAVGSSHQVYPRNTPQAPNQMADPDLSPSFTARWQPTQECLLLDTELWSKTEKVRVGDWIAIRTDDNVIRHAQIRDLISPNIYLSQAVVACGTEVDASAPLQSLVKCYLHDQGFDNIPHRYQQSAICTMLRCLPSISSVRARLIQQQKLHREASLEALKDIPQSSRDLLRWIIASNRSCIMQVDVIGDEDSDPESLQALEPRVKGMSNWVQFRFAQGAPDKEQRFIDAVSQSTLNAKYPTLFAWHGSQLHNWHSIIRQGLNFQEIVSGRSFGDGVYMSNQLNVSLGFSGIGGGLNRQWANSKLNATQVVSLQEVVNAPSSFVSSDPHFVVNQLDWIQTRYLFVKSNVKHSLNGIRETLVEQDPSRKVMGEVNKAIEIPITAISGSRRETASKIETAESKSRKKKKKKPKAAKGKSSDWSELNVDDDNVSVATDDEDSRWTDPSDDFVGYPGDSDTYGEDELNRVMAEINQLHEPFTVTAPPSPINERKRGHQDPCNKWILDPAKTTFRPGNLDMSSIRILPPPSDASPAASRALMRAFSQVSEVQENTPLHILGFFIDPDRMENIYQWIVELHTFDTSIPLAKDMTGAKVNSVVLEMLFTNQYPFSPPFIRVVRPRFLPFLSGGGGHITEGGAICMELLTSSGWSAASSMESVLMQVKMAISDTQRPARLLSKSGWRGQTVYDTSSYGIGEAVTAFKRACAKHGWSVPAGVDSLAMQ